MLNAAMRCAENGILPDWFIRAAIRQLLRRRLVHETAISHEDRHRRINEFVVEMKQSPIALRPEKANEQHYEVPARFFELVLGHHLKYSSCYWTPGINTLDDSEQAMLRLTSERAAIADGQQILELGCGWGSLTLWMAEHYSNSSIVAVSNSSGQRRFIEHQAEKRKLRNIEIITADMNDFTADRQFDRVVSIEMFEHMRNYEELLHRISGWLTDDGSLFVHIFCHREFAYPFIDQGAGDWMARYFFTGGLMPSANLLHFFQRDLSIRRQWQVNGTHYARTCREWLNRMKINKREILGLFAEVYGAEGARRWYGRWRIFFMACEELFDFRRGTEWFVGHYLFGKQAGTSR